MRITVEKVTPERAAEWLRLNVNNRNVRPHTVGQYAEDMRQGRWRVNGDPVRFNDAGELVDGQHRLEACVVADVAFDTVVIRGLSDEDKVTFDSGVKRTLADVLKFRGERSTHQLAAGIRACWLYENHPNPLTGRAHRKPSPPELLAWFERNREVQASVDVAGHVRRQVAIPATAIVVPHFFGMKVSPEDTVDFFEKLRTGLDLHHGSPVMALRRYLELLRPKRDKPPPEHTTALVIKAFNLYRAGEEVELLMWRAGGRNSEPYPRIKTDEQLLGVAA